MIAVLEVSKSGFYGFCRRLKQTKICLLTEIKKVIEERDFNDNYGAERVYLALKAKGIKAGLARIKRVMKEAGLAIKKKIYKKALKREKPDGKASPDYLNRDFYAEKLYEKCVMDTTEFPCREGKIYIVAGKDCCDGFVDFVAGDRMDADLAVSLVRKICDGQDVAGMIIHTDRGGQFMSKKFQDELDSRSVISSMGARGNCYDNARIESFFAILKKELLYRIPWKLRTKEHVISLLFRYINYYNRYRINSFNRDGMPPLEFRKWLMNNTHN